MKTIIILLAMASIASAQEPTSKAPAVPDAHAYVAIPNAALAPTRDSSFRAIFDATHPADQATHLVPALNMVGAQLNALVSVGAPPAKTKFVVVFHGPAVDGILDDSHYQAKFGTNNPNLKSIAEMKKLGVEFFVCGQFLAAEKIDPKTLTSDVTLAADSLMVLMHYQNQGYALLTF